MNTYIFESIGYDKSTVVVNAESKSQAIDILSEQMNLKYFEWIYTLDNTKGIRYDSTGGIYIDPALKDSKIDTEYLE